MPATRISAFSVLMAIIAFSNGQVDYNGVGGNDVTITSYPSPTEDFPHRAELDESGKYFLFWKFDSEKITFEIHVKAHGWVGLGFSDKGAMIGADMVVGWIKDGETHFKDRHAVANERPLVDTHQDYTLLESMETEEFTVLKFEREIEICDPDDRTIKGGTIRVLYAWSAIDPETEEFEYHGATRRGVKSIVLLDNESNYNRGSDLEEENLMTFKMTQNKARLPTNRTYYHCRVMKLPELSKKHHIVKISPLIETGNEGVVHHFVAYFCLGHLVDEDYGRSCWEGRMPENSTDCSMLVYAWGVGQGAMTFPPEAGLSIGGPKDSKFFHIEVHYDNPQGIEGITDSSGVLFHYTDKIRQDDIGILMTGNAVYWPPMIIPPKADRFQIDSFCGKSCTSHFPAAGINVFAAFLHTHLSGIEIWTKHIRNGTELPEITRDDSYDFNYQENRYLHPPVTVQQGDELMTSCVYNTLTEEKPKHGGAGTEDEMCFVFLYYYPRMSVQSCLSQVQGYYPMYQLIMQRAMAGEIHINPLKSDDENVIDYLEKLQWHSEDIEHVQKQVFDSIGYTQYCVLEEHGVGIFGGGETTFEKKVKIKEPYKPRTKCEQPVELTSGARGPIINLLTMGVYSLLACVGAI